MHFEDGSEREFEANSTAVGPDGSLQLLQRTEKRSGIVGVPDEVNMRLVRLIRRDLWREVEVVEYGEAQVIEIGRPELARVN